MAVGYRQRNLEADRFIRLDNSLDTGVMEVQGWSGDDRVPCSEGSPTRLGGGRTESRWVIGYATYINPKRNNWDQKYLSPPLRPHPHLVFYNYDGPGQEYGRGASRRT